MPADTNASLPDQAAVRGLPPLYFVLPLAIALALQYLVLPLPFSFPDGILVHGRSLRIGAGVLVGLFGIAVLRLTMRAHISSGNDPHPHTPTASLITTGLYRFSRNPGYLAFALMQTGIALAAGSVWALASVIVSLLLAHYLAVLPEEAYMERKFGEQYREYKKRVRRWI